MLFKHMKPFYHEQASQIFQIVRAALHRGEKLQLLALAFVDAEDGMLALNAVLGTFMEEDLLFICAEMKDRLKSRCAGLLEASGIPDNAFKLEVTFFTGLCWTFSRYQISGRSYKHEPKALIHLENFSNPSCYI